MPGFVKWKELSDWLVARAPEMFEPEDSPKGRTSAWVRNEEAKNAQQTWMYRRSAFEGEIEKASSTKQKVRRSGE